MTAQKEILLQIKDLKKYFPVRAGFLRRTVGYVKAVDGVNLDVYAGETLGLVGESGSGKTTLGRCIVRLYEPSGGQLLFRENGRITDLVQLDNQDMRHLRRNVQIIFQDPYASLNPRMNVLQTVGEPLITNGLASGKELEDRVKEAIVQVGLRVEHLRRYPHSFSGGQRQRIGIARALVVNPQLVVADEPVSALDVSIQAQILNLLKDLQQKMNLTYVFISHDMSVIRYISDRIAVMYAGKLAELGNRDDVLHRPKHPYTEALLASVPKASDHLTGERQVLAGEPPDLANLPTGCVFHPRCNYAQDICRQEEPELRAIGDQYASCHFAETLHLEGIPQIELSSIR